MNRFPRRRSVSTVADSSQPGQHSPRSKKFIAHFPTPLLAEMKAEAARRGISCSEFLRTAAFREIEMAREEHLRKAMRRGDQLFGPYRLELYRRLRGL